MPDTSLYIMTKSKRKQGRQSHKTGKRNQSSLMQTRPSTSLWNVNAQPWPAFHNTLKKDGSVHKFIQMVDFGTVLTASTGGVAGLGKMFQLTNTPQQTTFTALFDQYRIDEIELWFEPQTFDIVNAVVPWPKIYSVVDYDDAGTPTTVNQLTQYTNCMASNAAQGHYVRFKPHVAISAYSSGAFGGFQNRAATWIDSGSPSVEHYGFKALIPTAAGASATYTCTLTARFHLSFRNVF